jgi:hypothetical protein
VAVVPLVIVPAEPLPVPEVLDPAVCACTAMTAAAKMPARGRNEVSLFIAMSVSLMV